LAHSCNIRQRLFQFLHGSTLGLLCSAKYTRAQSHATAFLAAELNASHGARQSFWAAAPLLRQLAGHIFANNPWKVKAPLRASTAVVNEAILHAEIDASVR
jgi:hypothetical protein